jgi:hypothetical protein
MDLEAVSESELWTRLRKAFVSKKHWLLVAVFDIPKSVTDVLSLVDHYCDDSNPIEVEVGITDTSAYGKMLFVWIKRECIPAETLARIFKVPVSVLNNSHAALFSNGIKQEVADWVIKQLSMEHRNALDRHLPNPN